MSDEAQPIPSQRVELISPQLRTRLLAEHRSQARKASAECKRQRCMGFSQAEAHASSLSTLRGQCDPPAVPGWISRVHASHQLALVGGIAVCWRRGAYARSFKAGIDLDAKCTGHCVGQERRQQRFNRNRLLAGQLPRSSMDWVDGADRAQRQVWVIR